MILTQFLCKAPILTGRTRTLTRSLFAILNCAIHTALLLLLHIRILEPNQVCSREGGPAQGLTAS